MNLPNKLTMMRIIMIPLFLFFLLWDLGYIVFPQLKTVFDFLGIQGFVIAMVYVYCGWAFFD